MFAILIVILLAIILHQNAELFERDHRDHDQI